jgi:FkbM family methyltransferase
MSISHHRQPFAAVIIAYRRPDTLDLLLQSLEAQSQQPEHYYAVVDGACEDSDIPKIQRCIEMLTMFGAEVRAQPQNKGTKQTLIDGLDWAFNRYEHVIVVEDDIVLPPNVFDFLRRGLEHEDYKQNSRLATINTFSAVVHYPELKFTREPHQSYVSPRFYPRCWGTWRSRWQQLKPMIQESPGPLNIKRLRTPYTIFKSCVYWSLLAQAGYSNEWSSSFALDLQQANFKHIAPVQNSFFDSGHHHIDQREDGMGKKFRNAYHQLQGIQAFLSGPWPHIELTHENDVPVELLQSPNRLKRFYLEVKQWAQLAILMSVKALLGQRRARKVLRQVITIFKKETRQHALRKATYNVRRKLQETFLGSGILALIKPIRGARQKHRIQTLTTLLQPLIQKNALCFDVGANIGEVSQALLNLEGSHVIAIEPVPSHIEHLQTLVQTHPSLHVVPKAVSNHIEQKTLHIPSNSRHASFSTDFIRQIDPKDKNILPVEVETITLDALIEDWGIPDYCKIDVEGHTLEVLQGLSQSLPLLSFEIHAHSALATTGIDALNHLESLAAYEYNLLFNHAPHFEFPVWLSAEQMKITLKYSLSNLPNYFGDVFARRLNQP